MFGGYPLRTSKLTEAQVQDLLEFAITDGGLGRARAEYQNPLVADAPTAMFELNADGGSKTVSVVALGMEGEPGPDAAIKASLAALGERLKDFDRGGSLASDAYEPTAYRARAARCERRRRRPDPRLAVAGPHASTTSRSRPTRTNSSRARG